MLPGVRLPILVTGLPGVPGWALFRRLRTLMEPGEFLGVLPPGNRDTAGADIVYLDAVDTEGWHALFVKYHFGTVLDASGCCALKSCEGNPELSELVNRHLGSGIATLARDFGADLIRFSSDLVFSGIPGVGGYRESDAPDPVSEYGKSMARSEEEILRIYPEAWILRLALPMDWSPGGKAGAIDWISWRFRNQRPATLFVDEVRSVVAGCDLLPIVLAVLRGRPASGLWNCGGSRDLSLYQVAQMINVAGRFDPGLLRGCPRAEAGPFPPRAGHVGMDSSRLRSFLKEVVNDAAAEHGLLGGYPYDLRMLPDGPHWHMQMDRRCLPSQADMDFLLVGQ